MVSSPNLELQTESPDATSPPPLRPDGLHGVMLLAIGRRDTDAGASCPRGSTGGPGSPRRSDPLWGRGDGEV